MSNPKSNIFNTIKKKYELNGQLQITPISNYFIKNDSIVLLIKKKYQSASLKAPTIKF